MALTLKSSGVATAALAVVAVDDNNTTVKDFVSGNSITVDSHVTVGSGTWKGVSRNYFETKQGVDGFNFYGITWNTTKPVVPFNSEMSYFLAANSLVSKNIYVASFSAADASIQLDGTNHPVLAFAGIGRMTGTSAWSGKFSSAGIWRIGGTCEFWYGSESGSTAQDTTHTDTGLGSADTLDSFGGAAGGGYCDAKWHVFAVFNRALTTTEQSDLHTDWFGTLFNAPIAPSVIDFGGSCRGIGRGMARGRFG